MQRTYLEITDLPSDVNGSLGTLRRALLLAYNHNRDNEDKLKLLSDTLLTVLQAIQEDVTSPEPLTPLEVEFAETAQSMLDEANDVIDTLIIEIAELEEDIQTLTQQEQE